MVLLTNLDNFNEWAANLRVQMPHLDVRDWYDPTVRPEDVHYTLVWEPELGGHTRFPNLKLILSSAAGVDHIIRDPSLPLGVPIVRMVTEETKQRMAEFVCLAALALLRRYKQMLTHQGRGLWIQMEDSPCAQDKRVGILGLGALGQNSAAMLRGLGFAVAGWSRTPKSLEGIESFAGDAALPAFLARTDILVCLLPDTQETQGILRAETLALLPPGAGVINVGRGRHLVLSDLIATLDSGHLSEAVLDVFEMEPLPADHAAWHHPRITVTPHCASTASRQARAVHIARIISAHAREESIAAYCYNPAAGY